MDPRPLLGLSPMSETLHEYLQQLSNLVACGQLPAPELKPYPDALYMNYFPLGLSLMFVARDGTNFITREDVCSEKLILDSIDVYNVHSESNDARAKLYSPYPVPSLVLPLLPSQDTSNPRSAEIKITASSTGKEFVGILGEPDRKGGGAGPTSGSIGIWCEWSRDGIMVEFGGVEARGSQAWERGKDARWKTLTLFRLKDTD